jgi:hypothetical protein
MDTENVVHTYNKVSVSLNKENPSLHGGYMPVAPATLEA